MLDDPAHARPPYPGSAQRTRVGLSPKVYEPPGAAVPYPGYGLLRGASSNCVRYNRRSNSSWW